ncbi:MAG: right-handed parallel beta-helix repeat-containing protein [Kiritimatiellia bacterium]
MKGNLMKNLRHRFAQRYCVPLLLGLAFQLPAAEYFVALDGDDARDGSSRSAAFRTIQKGVDALKPGDWLTIAPGEYFEAVRREKIGDTNVETVIRAEIPGTVIVRGDVPLPAFRKLEGYRFVYVTDFDAASPIQVVNDLDAFATYASIPGIPGIDFGPGRFYHAPAEKKVYICTSDFSPAGTRRFTASMHNKPGIELLDAKRVRLEGLSVTGFRGEGILLMRPLRCVVSGCRAYLNGRGIRVNSSGPVGAVNGGNVIERCIAWANGGDGLGANVQSEDTIRDSLSFLNGSLGIRLYAGSQISRMSDNLSWGNKDGDYHMKSGIAHHNVERCVGPGSWPFESGGSHIRNCLVGVLPRLLSRSGSGIDFLNNIHMNDVLRDYPGFNPDIEFADPANHDYRLQANSRFRGAGNGGCDLGAYPYRTNIFFVSLAGSDQADGLSVSSSWATVSRAARALKPGDTLYIAPGRYAEDFSLKACKQSSGQISIRGRGTGTVELAETFRIENTRQVSCERLRFTGPVEVSGGGELAFEQCAFAGAKSGLSVTGVEGLRVIHCDFSGGGETQIGLSGCSKVFLAGNRFDNAGGAAVTADRPEAVLYSDYNAYRVSAPAWRLGGKDIALGQLPNGLERYGTAAESDARMALASGPYGRAVGNYRDDPGLVFRLAGPFVHAAGATSANIEWYASHRSRITLNWGTTPACTNGRVVDKERFDVESEEFGSISLADLAPGTKYYVRLQSVEPLDTPRTLTGVEWSAEPVVFETALKDADPVTYYVATNGSDAADGLTPDKPLRTITRAAELVRPGDTVRVAGGTYHECLYIRATGLPGRPITFAAQLGERVTLDGGINRELTKMVVGFDKSYLRVDGFYMKNYTMYGPYTAAIRWFGGKDVRLSRMFLDGRLGWPGPLFHTMNISDLLVRNCFSIGSMGGPSGDHCPRFRMENCVLMRNRIGGIQGGWAGRPEHCTVIRNSIITDCQANKIHQPIGPISASDTTLLENNAYFLRPERRIQLDRRMNMAEFEEQALRDGGLIGDPRFAKFYPAAPDALRPGFSNADGAMNTNGDMHFADFFATNPEFLRRGIGLDPDAFRGFEAGPLTAADLVKLADALPPQTGSGFGLRYRAMLKSLRDRVAGQPTDALRNQLREAFVAAEAAREARRDAEALATEARDTLARPSMGDVAALRRTLESSLGSLANLLADGQAELETVHAADRELREAVVRYDAGRLLQIRLPAEGWRFRIDTENSGRAAAWFKPDYDDKDWRKDVPIEKNWQDYMETPYCGVAWYRRVIDAPAIPKAGVKIWLNFYGVDEEAWVWLNGDYVGAHEIGEGGWDIPFKLDVTSLIKTEAPNQLTVMVRNRNGQGGIWQAIYLSVRDKDD